MLPILCCYLKKEAKIFSDVKELHPRTDRLEEFGQEKHVQDIVTTEL